MPAPEPLRFDMTLPNGQPLRWDMGPEYTWDGNVPASAYLTPPVNSMTTENRISAVLPAANLATILAHLQAARDLMPFLVNIAKADRNGIAKFGDKSQAFDDKIADYETQRPDLVPAFTDAAEANKDRALRVQMQSINGVLAQLSDDGFCTELALGGDIADHDQAVYSNIRFCSSNNVPGTQAIYDDLKQRYPSVTKKPAVAKPATP